PLPANVPVVDACESCNGSFSQDEEYVACLVECVLCGESDASKVTRPKIKRKLSEHPLLAARLTESRSRDKSGAIVWQPDIDSVRNVILKLARGHIAFELSLPRLDEPEAIGFVPLVSMTANERAAFESPA